MRVSEATKRWLFPAGLLATLAGLAVGGVLLGADNPLLAILVVPAVAVIVAALTHEPCPPSRPVVGRDCRGDLHVPAAGRDPHRLVTPK